MRRYSVTQALLNPKVLALSLVYFGAVATNYGLSFFLPQIVKAFGVSNFQAGLVAALPYVVGLVSIVWWGRRSDRKLERRFHLAFPLFVASAGIAISTALDDPTMKMAALSVAGFGIFGCLPVFWTFPTAFLSGAAAAGGIALINSIGNLAGFAGPYAMGRIKDLTGSYTGGLLSLSAVGFIAMMIVLALRTRPLALIQSRHAPGAVALIGGRERTIRAASASFVAVDVEPDTRRRKEFVGQPAPFHEPRHRVLPRPGQVVTQLVRQRATERARDQRLLELQRPFPILLIVSTSRSALFRERRTSLRYACGIERHPAQRHILTGNTSRRIVERDVHG